MSKKPAKHVPFFHPAVLLATWFGSGFSPKASGTAGSLAALPFAYGIHVTLGPMALFAAAFLVFAVGLWASREYMKLSGNNDDPGAIVIDEVAGQWLILVGLPPTLQAYALGFFVFRVFDVLKPWPICLADQKIPGALGVMLDDMLAGLYPYFLLTVAVGVSLVTGHGLTLLNTLYDLIH